MTTLREQIEAEAPDPADAVSLLERILHAAEHVWDMSDLSPDAAAILALCVSRAPYLAKLLARDPNRLTRVAQDAYLRRKKPKATLKLELCSVLPPQSDEALFNSKLRRFRADELVRLGVRELGFGTPVEVGRELAHLADTCMDAAIDFHQSKLKAEHGVPTFVDHHGNELEAQFVVIGMGKLGGRELNFVSDIDVIYAYSSDAGSAGSLSLHEYFCRLSERITASLGSVTEDDIVFHVDLRLRPEGGRGAIANSLASLERYYETWGHPWERQAWLKARPSAGNHELGEQVLSTLRPFIYPNLISHKVVTNVIELNRRIKSGLTSSQIEQGFDVKNGVGGIREIEFFAQGLQLVYAGKQPRLRKQATRPALDALLFAGLINATEHKQLNDAYEFLRRVEHLLQLESGRQTQKLPSDERALSILARRAGFPDSQWFLNALNQHTTHVEKLFATLDESQSTEEEIPTAVLGLLSPALEEQEGRHLLTSLGFRSIEDSWHLVQQARRSPRSPFSNRARGPGQRVASALLASVCTSPDPDQALRHVCQLISRRGLLSEVWRLFDANRPLMQLIVSLFGTSEYLARRFVAHPELIDTLVEIANSKPQLSRQQLCDELSRTVGALSLDTDEEDYWNLLAEFKNRHILRIGLADIGGVLDVGGVTQQLSLLAEICLQSAFNTVSSIVANRWGIPRCHDSGEQATMAVLALGKLGGAELGYASDLDIVFVYSTDGTADGDGSLDNVTYMTRLAQRLMSGLHSMHPGGRLYEVDTRLRPSGSKGLLVSSLASWNAYHQTQAQLWERQALIKLRPVAGDQVLGEKIANKAELHVYGKPIATDRLAASVHHMRERIERELAGPAPHLDVKTGPGGLIDVEFAAQFLQLAHGCENPSLHTTGTTKALRAAMKARPELADDCTLLLEGYVFLRQLENRMRIVHDRSVHQLPSDSTQLDILARRAGYPDGPALQTAYDQWTSSIRGAYRRVLGQPAEPTPCVDDKL